ncbi:MAG: helix-turn-helix transcriptional regulator [Candidatus Gastranaerophilaceae bacterium]|jgi:putative transcriptional regulator
MIKNNLSKIMGEKRINMVKLSELTGLSRNAIFQLYHDKTSQITFDTINKMCTALQCTTQELFEYIPD